MGGARFGGSAAAAGFAAAIGGGSAADDDDDVRASARRLLLDRYLILYNSAPIPRSFFEKITSTHWRANYEPGQNASGAREMLRINYESLSNKATNIVS